MDVPQDHINTLTESIDRYEQQARRRAWLSAIVPSIFGVLLLAYTIWQIQIYGDKLASVQQELTDTSHQLTTANVALQDASKQLEKAKADLISFQNKLDETTAELEKTRQELKDAQQQLQNTQEQLDQAEEDLKSTNAFIEYAFPVDVIWLKGGDLDQYPLQEEVLFDIDYLRYSGIGWNRNGTTEEEGFNSPGFASYVLQKYGLSNGYGVEAEPWKYLKPVDTPAIGDLVYYDGGYTMFYYEYNGEPFVIGMTPIGIVSLRPEFANILGYLHVPYNE
jgi:hypothetical protein